MRSGKRRAARRSPRDGGVQSVGIAAKVLKALAAHGGVLALKELAAATQMPRAKVHRYLASLRGAGLIEQDPQSGRYQIGATAVTIGLVGLGRLSPVRQLQAALPRLRERVGETVTAAIWGERGPTIVAIEESDHLVTMNIRVGTVLPLLTTAIGRLFLAHMPAATTRAMEAAERRQPAISGVTPSDDELAALLSEIRARNLSRSHGPLLPGVDALAAPVFDYRAKLVAVICVVGRAGAMNASWDGPVVRSLLAAADELSRQLGRVDAEHPPAAALDAPAATASPTRKPVRKSTRRATRR
jgi:DNA-binding IclR family transcriptional regulator